MNSLQGYRLSEQQKRLWDCDQAMALGVIDVRGPLVKAELKRAVESVVAAHEVLRTRFVRLPGSRTPLQVVEEHGQVVWNQVDLRECDVLDQEKELLALWE